MPFDPVIDMNNEHSDAKDRLHEILKLAHKIESLTSPSKDSEDFD